MLKAIIVLLMCTVAQIAFWHETRRIIPDMSIVPDVPGEVTVKALSFGDEHAFFRLLGLQLQTAGDTFGRFTALYKYDYNKVYHWFRLLDKLDSRSNFIPAMATYYYSQSQNVEDARYVVDYLVEHAQDNVDKKWWWLVQAVYLANHKLKDKDLAIQVAKKLEGNYNIPIWAKQIPAFIHEQRGEMDEALHIIDNILENVEELEEKELNFMRYFVEERIDRLEEIEDKLEHKRQQIQSAPAE